MDPSGACDQENSGFHYENEAQLFGWCYEFRCREVHYIRGGILGDAAGYGKTATTIGLMDSRRDAPVPQIPEDHAPYFFSSSATLILVPSNLLDQWLQEINKFLGDKSDGTGSSLRVVAVKTA